MISLTSLMNLHSLHWFPFLFKPWEATSSLNCLANSHIFLITFLFNEFEVPRAEAMTSLQVTKVPILSCLRAWNDNCLWISSMYCEWGVPRNEHYWRLPRIDDWAPGIFSKLFLNYGVGWLSRWSCSPEFPFQPISIPTTACTRLCCLICGIFCVGCELPHNLCHQRLVLFCSKSLRNIETTIKCIFCIITTY